MDFQSKHLNQQELAYRRENELRCAAKFLSIHDVSVYQFTDNQLSTISDNLIIETIKKEIITFSPNIVITFHPKGITGHQDHIKTSKCTTSAIKYLKNQPKLLYYGISDLQLSYDSQRKLYAMKDSEITHCIDIKDYFEDKNKAMKCHKTQEELYRQFQVLFSIYKEKTQYEFFRQIIPKFTLKKRSVDLFN